jgi:4-amino-4-deoxy-L-arabinose transferase-like glycosyltransferase
MRLVRGIAILLAITAPWFIAVSIANPEFPHYFFIHEHFERFLTKTHGRYQPAWYFIPILVLGMIPWLGSLVQSFRPAKASALARSLRRASCWHGLSWFLASSPCRVPNLPPTSCQSSPRFQR